MIKIDFHPDARILRQFAWLAVLGLPLVAGLVLRLFGAFAWTHPVFLAAAAAGVLQLGLFLAGVSALTRWAFVGLSVVAMPIGFVLSHVLIAGIYYLVFTPIGLVFRLIGRDALGRRLDPGKASYWHVREAVRPPSSYFKLY